MIKILQPLGAIALTTTFAACGSGSDCTGDYCGTIIIAQGADAESLFPPTMQAVSSTAIGDMIYLRLADLSDDLNTVGDGGLVPQLASSWTRLDESHLRFTLDNRAIWQDGQPVTAADVAFTYSVYTDTIVAAPLAANLDKISNVVAIDERTVEFEFTTVYPEQLFDAAYHMRILPAHLMDSIETTELLGHELTRNPVGTGPYRLHQWLPGQFIELHADTSFFLGRPGLRRIIWQVTPDYESALALVVSEQADLIDNMRTPRHIEQANSAAQLRAVEFASGGYAYLQFGLRDAEDPSRPHALFQDRTLRRALSMAVDRETTMRAVYGDFSTIAVAPVSPLLSIWGPDLPRIDYNRDRAVELLEGLGWRDSDGDGVRDRNGMPLSFQLAYPASDPNRTSAAVIIQDQLRQVGVDAQLAGLELNSLLATIPTGKFDVYFGFYGQDPTPSSIRGNWGTVGIGGGNFGSYSNPRVDDLMDRAIATFDPEESRSLWYQALEEMVADAPAIFLYSPKSVLAVHRRFENVTVRPDQWAATMWTWQVPETRMIDRDKAGS